MRGFWGYTLVSLVFFLSFFSFLFVFFFFLSFVPISHVGSNMHGHNHVFLHFRFVFILATD